MHSVHSAAMQQLSFPNTRLIRAHDARSRHAPLRGIAKSEAHVAPPTAIGGSLLRPLPRSSPASMLRTRQPLQTVTHALPDVAQDRSVPRAAGNGTFALMLICTVVFILDNLLHLPGMHTLYLYNAKPHWWQFITHQVCHANLSHLSNNLFQLLVFGRFVEDTEGPWGVVLIFLLTGLGAAVASTLLLPSNTVSVGASGAIFGLFATSVLLRLTGGLNFKLLLEAVVLGNFVVRQVMEETRSQLLGGTVRGGLAVSHVAHLAGAMAGVLLVFCVLKLTDGLDKIISFLSAITTMRWEKVEQKGDVPIDRSSHSVTALGDKLFLYGGEHDPRIPIDSNVFCFDIATRTWSTLDVIGTVPRPRLGHAAAAVGTDLYIFGGRESVEMGEGALDELWVFDTVKRTWSSPSTSGTPPCARSYHTMASAGHKLYVFGGCGSEGRLNDLYEYNTQTSTWRALPTNPDVKPRGGACLVTSPDGTKLFVMGGFCGHELADVYVFDTQVEQWEPTPAKPLPVARSVFGGAYHGCSGACNRDGSVLAFGGEVDPSDKGHEGAGDFSADLLGHSQDGWSALECEGDKPGPRGWYASTCLKGDLVVHGGLGGDNNRRGDLYILHTHHH